MGDIINFIFICMPKIQPNSTLLGAKLISLLVMVGANVA
jgi:hypothetical protein